MLSTIQEIAARMAAHGAVLPGKTIRIDAKDAGVIHLDGVNGRVLPGGDAPADAVMHISLRDLAALVDGQIDSTVCCLLGKLRLEGETHLVFRLQEIFNKARETA